MYKSLKIAATLSASLFITASPVTPVAATETAETVTGTVSVSTTALLAPTVTGPIPSEAVGSPTRNYPFGAATQNLASRGYAEDEYFFSGKTSLGGDYTSRMIVRKPSSPENFSGNVFVEWLNVSLNHDLDALWLRSSEQVLRNGDIYIGVSAQTAGINGPTGLKEWNPQRYSEITIPPSGSGPAELAAGDIFAQALHSIRHPSDTDVLGGLAPQSVIATGTSQSAGTLLAYSTMQGAVLKDLVDGYLITALSTATLQTVTTGTPLPLTAASLPFAITALGVPVMVLNTETDPSFLALPEVGNYRLWEIAGTTHADYDQFTAMAPIYERDFDRTLVYNPGCGANPYSRIPFRYAQNAAMAALTTWVRTGTPAPAQPRFQYNLLGAISRDAAGNALGGVRLPEHDVPTATNRPENTGPVAECVLPGQSTPFSSERLRELYPTHAVYVNRIQAAIQRGEAAGVLLPADGEESLANARQSRVP